ncbi:MAG TPA: DUF1524 domain-containing protein [Ornithinibacter sp.]|nr:DUF1524 domain-containing protein [Ornithinibacter sp.]
MSARAGWHPASLFGWGGLGLTALLGAATSGVSGLFSLAGFYVFVVAVVALVRGRVPWARLRTRAAGGAALGVAIALAVVGGATADPQVPPPAATASSVAPDPSATAAPTATPQPTVPPTVSPTPSPSPTTTATPPVKAAKGTALAAVARLTVKGRAPKTGYSRDLFGQAWFDTDRNGCDTRNDILRRDLTHKTMKNWCKVLAGTRAPDPYTGSAIRFVLGGASEIDIDHLVPLSDAWQKGAARWSAGKRLAFANDPLTLLAVDAGANRSKGDGDAATWLPPNKAFRCQYVARQVAVKLKYGVWVTTAEREAMVRVLSRCPTTPLPGAGSAPTVAALPRSSAPAPTPPTSSSSTYYANCDAVRAAGAAPLRVGQPGYSRKLDRDGDGVACE